MTSTVLKIDLSILDNEISELRSELNKRLDLRQFITTYGEPITSPENEKKTTLEHVLKVVDSKVGSENIFDLTFGDISKDLQISDFLIQMLKQQEFRYSKDLMSLYGVYVGKKPEDVRNNVSNALARLKDAGKVDNQIVDGERAAKWFVKK